MSLILPVLILYGFKAFSGLVESMKGKKKKVAQKVFVN